MTSDSFTPSQLNTRDLDRIRSYKDMLDFYEGYQWHRRTIRNEKQLTFNYAKVIIDKVTAYMMAVAQDRKSVV